MTETTQELTDLGTPATVGELIDTIELLPINADFGFRNQPMQHLYYNSMSLSLFFQQEAPKMASREKMYLSHENLDYIGFTRKGQGEDPRDFWYEVDLSNAESHKDKIVLCVDCFSDASLQLEDYDLSIPLNFQSIQEIEQFIKAFKRPFNHAFSSLLDLHKKQ